jgi:hypothetical protein
MTAESGPPGESSRRIFRPAAVWPAFRNLAILFSFTVNFVLVIILLILAGWILFPTKTDIVEPMLDDLQSAVNALDDATIYQTIYIDEQVPVNFSLPVKQSIAVILTEDVPLVQPATFVFPATGGVIRGTVSLSLPKGMALPIHLEMDVPVDNTIRVQFPVDVTIPLKETELNQMVVKLNDVLIPIRDFLDGLPDGF